MQKVERGNFMLMDATINADIQRFPMVVTWPEPMAVIAVLVTAGMDGLVLLILNESKHQLSKRQHFSSKSIQRLDRKLRV